MPDYRLTKRGKFVLGLFILILVILIVYSGNYIVRYIIVGASVPHEISETNDPMTNEETRTTENSTETSTETTEVVDPSETIADTSTETSTETEETIYSATDLEDLKQFKIIFYFSEDSSEIELNSDDLLSIQAMISEHPSEKIAIEGHVNGYPNYESDEYDKKLSMDRALVIEKALEEIGVDKTLLNVYNFGSESPLFTDYGNQYKNDRVEVYFIDHFIKASQGK